MPFVLLKNDVAFEVFNEKPVLHPELMQKVIETSETVKTGQPFNGEGFDPVPEPVKRKPLSVTMRQARLALHGAGLLPDVQNAIDGLTEPDRTQAAIEWEYASTVEREGPITQMLAGAMGLTSEELDQLFETAAGL